MNKQIKELGNEIFLNCSAGLSKSEAEAISRFVIEKMGYRKRGEWVDVYDRLPEIPDSYIVCCYDGSVRWAFFYDHFPMTVTHWMPIPEPPGATTPIDCAECGKKLYLGDTVVKADGNIYCPSCGAKKLGGETDA